MACSARSAAPPWLHLSRVTRGLPATVEVWAKVEWANPSGSVRDRPAAAIITRALQNGWLTSEKILLESSSGNIGMTRSGR